MGQWNERFQAHPVWQQLQAVGPIIDQALERDGKDAAATDALARLKSVHIYVSRRLAGADQFLLTPSPLDGINSAFQSIASETQSFVANGVIGHLTNANSHADTALTHVGQLVVPTTTEDFQGARQASEKYREGMEKALTNVLALSAQSRVDAEALRTKLLDLSATVDNERTRLLAVTTDFQGQFSAAQETRNREYSESQKSRQDAFSQLMGDYAAKLVEQNSAFTKQREDLHRSHEAEIDDLKKHFVNSTSRVRDEIVRNKDEVQELLGVIGSSGVTAGYQRTAKEAKWTTRIWQGVTVVSLVGLIVVAVIAFLPVVQGVFSWSAFAGKVFVAVTVGLLAAYSASQADKYQKLERTNHRLALELQAIGPFIAPLTKEQQDAFRLKIGDRSFGHQDFDAQSTDTKSPTNLLDLLLHSKEFKSFVTDVVKATRS